MNRCHFLLFLGLVLLFSACEQGNIDQETIKSDDLFANYFLLYNAKENRTLAAVAFCKDGECGGNEVELPQGESITFNGEALVYENKEYEKWFDGYIQSGTFTWKTADGRTFINNAQLEPIAFSPDLDTIKRSENLQLTWSGKTIQPAESVVLYLLNADGFMISSETQGAQSLMVPVAELNKVQNIGKKELILDRQKHIPLQQGGKTGGIIGSIYRDQKEVIFQ